MGAECGISHNTAKAWLSILESSFIIYMLQPHHKNFNKRLVKQQKLYFYDTGLVCALLGIEEPSQVQTHYAKGALFENMIVMEIMKNRLNKGKEEGLYFWRDNHGHEIDILIEDMDLTPIEVKASKTVISDFFQGINYWNSLSEGTKGYVVYAGEQEQSRGDVKVIKWNNIANL